MKRSQWWGRVLDHLHVPPRVHRLEDGVVHSVVFYELPLSETARELVPGALLCRDGLDPRGRMTSRAVTCPSCLAEIDERTP